MAKGKLIGRFDCKCGATGNVYESTKVNKAAGTKFAYQRCDACSFQGMSWTPQSDKAIRDSMRPLKEGEGADEEPTLSATQAGRPKKSPEKKPDEPSNKEEPVEYDSPYDNL